MEDLSTFKRGFTDALPVMFGYLAVGFTVAVTAVAYGHPAWSPVMLAMTQLSGTSEGATISNINFIKNDIASFNKVVLICLALNLRYILLSFAVAQKLKPETTLAKRMAIATVITDENVAIAVSRPFTLTWQYLCGMLLSSYIGWSLGNLCGVFGSSLLPASVPLEPLSIALYAMFIAIITPEARRARPILFCVIGAILLNVLFLNLPYGFALDSNLSMLLSGVISALCTALCFPHKNEERDNAAAKEDL